MTSSSNGNITNLENLVTWNIDKLEGGQSVTANIVVTTESSVLCQEGQIGKLISNTAILTYGNILNPSSITTDTVETYVDCTCQADIGLQISTNEIKNSTSLIGWCW